MYEFSPISPQNPPFTKRLYLCPGVQGRNNPVRVTPAVPRRLTQSITRPPIGWSPPTAGALRLGLAQGCALAAVNEPPGGALPEEPGLADWMWKKAPSVFGGRERRMGIVLQFLLGIKQVEVLKTL